MARIRAELPTAEPVAESRKTERLAPRSVQRFKAVALTAVFAALVPYLWVLWDLWTGTINTFRIVGSKSDAGSLIYDLQARALLHGHLSLPNSTLAGEAFIHDGRTYTYFGLFPSLIRIPIFLFTHSLDGRLSGPSILVAWIVTALFTSLLVWRVRIVVRGEVALGWAEAASYGLLIFSVLAGSVLMSLASTPWVYTEDEAWSVALAAGSIFALVGLVERPSWTRLAPCGVLVLLSNLNRGTTGYACVFATFLIAAWFGLGRGGPERRRWALPLLGVGFLALVVGCVIDYAKFSQLFGYPSSEQLLFQWGGQNRINGGKRFSLHFLPSTMEAYLSPQNLRVTSVFPFLTLPSIPSQLTAHTQLFNRGQTVSIPASMPLLFGAGVWGVIATLGFGRPVIVRAFRLLLVAAAASAGALLIYGSIFERFVGDFMPVLILASTIGVIDLWRRLGGRQRAGRLLVSAAALLAVFEFVANVGIAVAPQQYWTQTQARNYVHAVKAISDITGHPLAGHVERSNPSSPNHAPIGELFIKGRCMGLYMAFDSVVPILTFAPQPWLPVERAPDTPICDSLIPGAPIVPLGVRITAPLNHETVKGPDVPLVATTTGAGRVSSVSFVIPNPPDTTIERGTRTGSTWTYRWDAQSLPNGTYFIRGKVRDSLGHTAVSPDIRVIVDNPGG